MDESRAVQRTFHSRDSPVRHMTTFQGLATASILVVAAVSCGNAPSKAGGSLTAVALRATSTGAADTPGGDLMEAIKAKADALSNGAVKITIGDLADGDSGIDQDGAAIKLVGSGSADIAVVRAAAFSAVGVTDFAALQAPFLIENEQVAESVAADPIAATMLDSVDRLDLVGLAVAPSGLRHPFGWHKPLVGVADYAGATINTRPGVEIDKLFDALGAKTDHSVGVDRSTAAATGELDGVEVSLQQHLSTGPPLIMTADVVLYSKFDVVIVNKKLFNGMNRAQRDVLRAAVTAAIPETIGARQTETAAFADWCAQKGNVAVLASASDVSDLESATTQLIGELESDLFTKKAIGRIRELAAGTGPVELGACAGPVDESVQIEAIGDQRVIDGTWRFEVTAQNLLDAGVPPGEVAKDVGVNTYIFVDGILSAPTLPVPCYGAYKINGNQLSWAFNPDSCGGTFRATFTRDGDEMTFAVDESTPDGPYFAGVFKDGLTRIGDVP